MRLYINVTGCGRSLFGLLNSWCDRGLNEWVAGACLSLGTHFDILLWYVNTMKQYRLCFKIVKIKNKFSTYENVEWQTIAVFTIRCLITLIFNWRDVYITLWPHLGDLKLIQFYKWIFLILVSCIIKPGQKLIQQHFIQ